jgi:uncharacterized protein YbjT (DUF2867 family)
MTGRIVVFGATGYTGRLVAERLAGAGERPVLAGRSPEKLRTLADSLGGLETAHGDVMRSNSVFELVEEGDVLVSTVGPFTKWGEPAVRAAITGHAAAYIDSTGEPAFIRRVFERRGHGPRGPAAACSPPLATTGCRAIWPARSPCARPAMPPPPCGSAISSAARPRRGR